MCHLKEINDVEKVIIDENKGWKIQDLAMSSWFTWHMLAELKPCDQGNKTSWPRNWHFTSPNNIQNCPFSFVLAQAVKLHLDEGLTMPPRLISPAPFRTPTKLWRKSYSTAPRVRLAYDLHEPAKPSSNAPGAIIFMHGLFGSKKNNRSISKWAFYVPPRPDNRN